MYGMTNSGKLFADDLTEWLLDTGFIQYQCQTPIYYKYAPDGTNVIFLSYVNDCVYWYTYEALGKWFVDTLGKIFHVKFLGYSHWFMSIIISQMKDHSFIWIRLDITLMLLQNNWILPQLRQVQSFIRPIYYLI